MFKKTLIYIILLLFGYSVFLNSQNLTYKDCSIILKNDTLCIKNNKIRQQFLWNSGHLILLNISNNENGQLIISGDHTPDFMEFSDSLTSKNAEINIKKKQFSPLDPFFLQAEIIYSLNELQVKRTINIFPETAAISHSFSLKGNVLTKTADNVEENELTMIEKDDINIKKQAGIGKLSLSQPHWNFEVVNFKEATDYHNTLTSKYTFSAYSKPEKAKGNILIGTNKLQKLGFFIIKEAPLHQSQADYKGYDFQVSNTEVILHGLGIPAGNIQPDNWTQGYGYTIGVGNVERNSLLLNAKLYQKQQRKLLQHRDEMLLANTWGDRSKDSRMNEFFILEELEACARLGITHLQLDDGWQQGLSRNSASQLGYKWDDWSKEDWEPHKDRFPNGFRAILKSAKEKNIEICLWFNPGKKDDYIHWERDADILIDFYKIYGIKVFKIDGIELSSKAAEINLRKFFEKVKEATNGHVVFNLDVTAGHRMGYFYFMEYGNLFLENRYTDWGNYYPHSTLRNLWMLSEFISAEKIQVEFLNKWRNPHKYEENDPLAPANIPFYYQIASTFAGQPLAWMEVSQLPEVAFNVTELLKAYKKVQHDFHQGIIMPIADEPNGLNWSGFQSVNDKEGYILLFRAYTNENEKWMELDLPVSQKIKLEHILGDGKSFEGEISKEGKLKFTLPEKHSFALYKYSY